MTTPAALQRIRRIAHGFDQPDDREWIAAALRRYLAAADDGLSIEDALELTAPARAMPWWRVDALARRDMALCELARVFYPSPSLSQRAAGVYDALARYARAEWPRDQRLESMPVHYVGTPAELLFSAMKAHPEMLSERQVTRIVAK
ncbi:hypothetical protein [Mesorhizobium sp. M0058]|uniref:hypothetical protein n=1 Tax=Mesorhizobium sp. M0058 TaxID=2956865 RepID=UPI003334B99C